MKPALGSPEFLLHFATPLNTRCVIFGLSMAKLRQSASCQSPAILQPMRFIPLLCLPLLLMACASTDQTRVSTAAATPLNDFNLGNAPIPEVLKVAQRSPYAAPASQECPALAAEIAALDAVLGPDVDAADKKSGDFVGDEAANALQRTAEGIVPFRGWIRKLTGAERHSREVSNAIAAGSMRRAYLKGIRYTIKCS
jgi:hypothetical protein